MWCGKEFETRSAKRWRRRTCSARCGDRLFALEHPDAAAHDRAFHEHVRTSTGLNGTARLCAFVLGYGYLMKLGDNWMRRRFRAE